MARISVPNTRPSGTPESMRAARAASTPATQPVTSGGDRRTPATRPAAQTTMRANPDGDAMATLVRTKTDREQLDELPPSGRQTIGTGAEENLMEEEESPGRRRTRRRADHHNRRKRHLAAPWTAARTHAPRLRQSCCHQDQGGQDATSPRSMSTLRTSAMWLRSWTSRTGAPLTVTSKFGGPKTRSERMLPVTWLNLRGRIPRQLGHVTSALIEAHPESG